jgi:hypothetical protein
VLIDNIVVGNGVLISSLCRPPARPRRLAPLVGFLSFFQSAERACATGTEVWRELWTLLEPTTRGVSEEAGACCSCCFCCCGFPSLSESVAVFVVVASAAALLSPSRWISMC